tara:strand:+ start:264 stop:575 length:312 start_codon:yes stop_codon:yes gene_type:complete
MSEWNFINCKPNDFTKNLTEINNNISNIGKDINKININELNNDINTNLNKINNNLITLNNKFETLINVLKINEERKENILKRSNNIKKKIITPNLLKNLFEEN